MSPELQVALIIAGCTAIGTWGVWLTRSVMGYNKEDKDYAAIKEQYANIKKEFNEMEERVHSDLDRFDKRQELFLRTEIAEMKAILRDEGINRGRQRSSK